MTKARTPHRFYRSLTGCEAVFAITIPTKTLYLLDVGFLVVEDRLDDHVLRSVVDTPVLRSTPEILKPLR